MRAMEGARQHWPAVEAWRGVAALLVLAAHWAPLLSWKDPVSSFGFVGVDIFFVISGFVFAPQMLGHGPQSVRGYALRRVMRIYPAYLAALAAYAWLRWWEGRPLLYLPEHLVMAHVQSREMAFFYAAPFWSLPAEVAFYVAVPILGWASLQLRRRSARIQAAFWLCVAALAVGMRGWLMVTADAQVQNGAYLGLHHLPGLLVEFLVGTAAWSVLARWQRQSGGEQRTGLRPAWAFLGLATIGATCVAWNLLETSRGHDWFHGQLGIVVALSFGLVLVATAGWRPASPSARKAAEWTGRLSYGTYLLHPLWGYALQAWVPKVGPEAALVAGAVGLLTSVWALNVLIEEPARRWGRRACARWEGREV